MRVPRYPAVASSSLPYLTRQQMEHVDHLMIDVYGIQLLQMMENAGRHLAGLARERFLEGTSVGRHVVALSGHGGNGGGAMVCARHLANWGSAVTVALTRAPEALSGVPAHQLEILRKVGVRVIHAADLDQDLCCDLVVDGLIGYSLSGAPRGTAADMIRWANAQDAPILSLDTPSGLDVTTGEVYTPAVRASATMTLALPKVGLKAPAAQRFVGELYLADISVPPSLYRRMGLAFGPIFAEGAILRISPP
ncbi:MAG: NAD(P)H-hydrate epimerase [Anaerolineae bacterium]|nr:NAD(P)H-hydrate epimerase [Anaerolineae bacterium]